MASIRFSALFAIVLCFGAVHSSSLGLCDFSSSSTVLSDSCSKIQALSRFVSLGIDKKGDFVTPQTFQDWFTQTFSGKSSNDITWDSIEQLGYKFMEESSDSATISVGLEQNQRAVCKLVSNSLWGVCARKSDNMTVFISAHQPSEFEITTDKIQVAVIYGNQDSENKDSRRKLIADDSCSMGDCENAAGCPGNFLFVSGALTLSDALSPADMGCERYAFSDLYEFNTSGYVSARVSQSNFDFRLTPQVYLYDADGTFLDNSATIATSEGFEGDLLNEYKYLVQVTSCSEFDEGGYNLYILGTQDPCIECISDSQCAPSSYCSQNTCDPVGDFTPWDCTGDYPFIDYSNGGCLQCVTAAHCPGGAPCLDGMCYTCSPACQGLTPYCNITTFQCQQCNINSECASNNCVSGTCAPVCSTGTFLQLPSMRCVQCLSDANCNGGRKCIDNTCQITCTTPCTGSTPICDPTSRTCRQCLTNTDCPSTLPLCTNNQCRICATDAVCAGRNDGHPFCGTGSMAGKCVQCKTDAQCTSILAPACNVATGMCGPCTVDSSCTAGITGHPFCSPVGHCVECEMNSQCTSASASRCRNGRCIGCSSDGDCTGQTGKPFCIESTRTCVACRTAGDCGSGEYCVAGTCVSGSS